MLIKQRNNKIRALSCQIYCHDGHGRKIVEENFQPRAAASFIEEFTEVKEISQTTVWNLQYIQWNNPRDVAVKTKKSAISIVGTI